MGLILRQSLKSSLGFYIGIGLGAINTLFISTRFLSPDQLAISRILIENSIIFAAFAYLGTTNIGDKFFVYFKDESNRHNGFLTFLLIFPLLGFTLFCCVYFYFEADFKSYFIEKSPTIIPYISLSVPMTLSWIYISVLDTYCRLNGRTAIPTFIREVLYKSLSITAILLFGFGWVNFDQYLYINVGILFITFLAFLVYIKILGKLYISWNRERWSKGLVFDIFKFGSLVVVAGIGSNLILFLDRNIIASEIGTTAVAIFSISIFIATVIEIPSKAVRQISGPILASAIFDKNQSLLKDLYHKSALNLLLIGGALFTLIFVNIDSILFLIPNNEVYKGGKWVVVIIGLAKWVDMSLGLNNEIITYTKYYVVNTVLVLCMTFFAIYINFWLIPIFGIIGSAIATASVILISSGFRLGFVWSKLKLFPYSRRDLKTIFLLILIPVCGYLILPNLTTSRLNAFLSIIINSLIICTVFIYVTFRFKLSPDILLFYENNIKERLFKGRK